MKSFNSSSRIELINIRDRIYQLKISNESELINKSKEINGFSSFKPFQFLFCNKKTT
jgi:hypothetical protein